jgi:hypothetical protein
MNDMRRTLSLCLFCLVSFTGGCVESTEPGTCSPAPFTACSGNELVTCVGTDGEEGTPVRTDCTGTGQFCLGSGIGSAGCSAPVLDEFCFGRNTTGCAAGDQLLRCVWVSEQPESGVSGDVGVWRVQTDCTAIARVCPIGAAACSAP